MALRPPSAEQASVIEAFHTGNVMVDSVAGSGKTTTIMHIAAAHADCNMLLLTYNKRLRQETLQRAASGGITNIQVHTYHSFAVHNLDPDAHTDLSMLAFLRAAADVEDREGSGIDRSATQTTRPMFHALIVDEAQDMTLTYYGMACYVLRNFMHACPRVVVLGDQRQSIFAFNGADARFLTLAPQLFAHANGLPWSTLALRRTFRCSPNICAFLNDCVLGWPLMVPGRARDGTAEAAGTTGASAHGVTYMVCNAYGDLPTRHVLELLLEHPPDDIFILAPSVRRASPVRALANRLTRLGVPIFVPVSDDEKLDDDVVRGKLVFSTFHQTKGLERAAAVVFGMDASYFRFFCRGWDPAERGCPNEVYVALTRARLHLTLIHNHRHAHLPFLNQSMLAQRCHMVQAAPSSSYVARQPQQQRQTEAPKMSVTELLRHLPSSVVEQALACIQLRRVRQLPPGTPPIRVPTKAMQEGQLVESVAEITGTAVVAAFEYEVTGRMSIGPALPSSDSRVSQSITASRVLCLATQYCASQSKYNFKLRQISSFTWLTQSRLEECLTRLRSLIAMGHGHGSGEPSAPRTHVSNYSQGAGNRTGSEVHFEREYVVAGGDELGGRGLIGRVDMQTPHAVFELKCTKTLSYDHVLQLAMYAYLVRCSGEHTDGMRYWLYNVLRDELVEVCASAQELCRMVRIIVQHKNQAPAAPPDDSTFMGLAARVAASNAP